MPFVKIYLKKREGIDKSTIANTLREIMHDIIKTPIDDGPVMFFDISEDNWYLPANWSENKTFVEILMYPGRRRESKERLMLEIARRVAGLLRIDQSDVVITLLEPPLDNWGIAGGQQASQIGVDFKLDV